MREIRAAFREWSNHWHCSLSLITIPMQSHLRGYLAHFSAFPFIDLQPADTECLSIDYTSCIIQCLGGVGVEWVGGEMLPFCHAHTFVLSNLRLASFFHRLWNGTVLLSVIHCCYTMKTIPPPVDRTLAFMSNSCLGRLACNSHS